jgi:hypothetical protein
MRALVRVLACMVVRCAVAAERDAAFLADPLVDPWRPDLYAFFAFTALRLFDGRDRFEVRTRGIIHDRIISLAKYLMNRGYGD